jgi:trk system potassium uptake protein TrkA
MRVFIAGAGQAGVGVAVQLADIGHDVSIMERDSTLSKRAFEDHGIAAHVGDATDAALLREAEVGRADVVVAMLVRDADNLAVALLARELGARRVMVRMRDIEYRGAYERAGVHRILSETEIVVGAMAMSIEYEAVQHAMLLGKGDSVAFELTVPAGAAVAGKTVGQIASDPAFPKSCVFGGLFDSRGMSSPRGASVVEIDTTLLLVSRREDMSAVVQFFSRKG